MLGFKKVLPESVSELGLSQDTECLRHYTSFSFKIYNYKLLGDVDHIFAIASHILNFAFTTDKIICIARCAKNFVICNLL